jgi:tetratricopeptide (TPR) repeat protein
MKKVHVNILFMLLAVFVLSSCGGLNKMKKDAPTVKYDVTPEVLEAHAGEVSVAVKGTYPQKYFDKKTILELTPVIKYEGGETKMNSITLQGESVKDNNPVIKVEGGSFSYADVAEFKEEMKVSELEVRIKATRGNKTVDFDPVKLADGVIATSTLVVNKPKSVMLKDNFKRIVPDTKEAQILYLINRAEVRPAELRKDEIVALRNFIAEAAKDERIELKEAGINAYASPDGPIDLNEKLSENRKASANKVLSGEFSKAKVEEAKSPDFYNTKSLGEDWDGFKTLMEQSEIQDKELILRVLSMYSDPVVREKEIKNIAAAYTEIAEKVLPQLRRSVLAINYEKIGYSDEEILEIWTSGEDKLNLEEILYGATLVEDWDTKLAMYKKAAEKYPNCFRAHNNVGYVYMKMKDPAEAKAAFESAQKIADNDVAKNNLGAVALVEGDIEKAEELFTSVSKASDETNYNLGIISLMKGDYAKASNYFGSACNVNSGLARILNNQVDDAYRLLNCIEEPGAMAYYLKAVIGARKQDNTILFDNLRTAVDKDGSLKAHAKTDMEFAKYFQDATFRSIVE